MAILYGTQSNGETLPVLVDQFGNLLAKGIEGQPGEPGEQGPPGQIGPQGPKGEGVPIPYGDELNVLQIKDGVPVWQPYESDDPELVECINLFEKYELRDGNNNIIDPADPYEWLKSQPTWGDNTIQSFAGASFKYANTSANQKGADRFVFNIPEIAGELVFTVQWQFYYKGTKSGSSSAFTLSTSNPDVPIISNNFSGWVVTAGQAKWNPLEASFLVTPATKTLDLTVIGTTQDMEKQQWFIRDFKLESSGTFALNRQMQLAEEVRALAAKVASNS